MSEHSSLPAALPLQQNPDTVTMERDLRARLHQLQRQQASLVHDIQELQRRLTPRSSFYPLPGVEKGESHRAVVFVTGWPAQDHQGRLHIMGVPITTLKADDCKQRLEVVLPLTSRPGGRLKSSAPLRVRLARAHRSNGSTFEVVGQLVRCERGTGHLLLNVYHGTQGNGQAVHLRVTDQLIRRLDPDAGALQVRGSVLDGLLVASSLTPCYAPIQGDAHARLRCTKQQALKKRQGMPQGKLQEEVRLETTVLPSTHTPEGEHNVPVPAR